MFGLFALFGGFSWSGEAAKWCLETRGGSFCGEVEAAVVGDDETGVTTDDGVRVPFKGLTDSQMYLFGTPGVNGWLSIKFLS